MATIPTTPTSTSPSPLSKTNSANGDTSDIILLIGLPGSGKSYLGERLSKERGIPFYDDATDLPNHPGFVLTHPAFCNPETLERVCTRIGNTWPNAPLTLLYFANDPKQATINAATRKNKPVAGYIRQLSKVYAPPEPTIPVWHA